MRLLISFFILFVFSCSKNNEELVDIDSFLNEGKKIELYFDQNKLLSKKNNITKIKNISYFQYLNWSQDNFNSRNIIYPSKKILKNKIKNISGSFQKVLAYKDKIITISNSSVINIFNLNLKKEKFLKIYSRKVVKNYSISFQLAIYQDKIYISDNLGNLHCYDLENLKLIWSKQYGVPFKSNIKFYKNNLFILNNNSKIFSINILNGNLNWSFETSSTKLKDKSSYNLAIIKNKLFFINDNAEIFCLDLDNKKLIWTFVFDYRDSLNTPLIFRSSPIVIEKDLLFISTNFGFTYAINISSGVVKWRVPFFSNQRMIFDERNIYIIHLNNFFIFNKSNGNLLFYKSFFKGKKKDELISLSDIFIGKNHLYLFGKNGELISINKNQLSKFELKKIFKSYKDYIIYKNNFIVLSNKDLIIY